MSLTSQLTASFTARTVGGAMLGILLLTAVIVAAAQIHSGLPGTSGIDTLTAKPELIRPAHWHTPALPVLRQLH